MQEITYLCYPGTTFKIGKGIYRKQFPVEITHKGEKPYLVSRQDTAKIIRGIRRKLKDAYGS